MMIRFMLRGGRLIFLNDLIYLFNQSDLTQFDRATLLCQKVDLMVMFSHVVH